MLKKSLYTVLSAAFCTFAGISAHSQSASLTLPAANITGQTQYNTAPVVNNGTVGTLALGGGVYVACPTGSFPATPVSTLPSLPLTVLNVLGNAVGTVNILNSTQEITMATTPKKFFTSGVVAGGAVSSFYKINTVGVIWQAGVYSAPLNFTADGIGNTVTPASQPVTITVPAFITTTVPVIPTVNLNVNSLAFYTNGISVNSQVTYHTTILTALKLKTGAANFTYTPLSGSMTDPLTAAGKMSVALTGTVTGPGTALSTTDATISPGTGIPLTYTANLSLPVPTFSISAADLKTSFVKAGTYDISLAYTASPFSGTLTSNLALTGAAKVTVANLGAFSSTTSSINLAFGTAANYTQGVTRNVTGQLSLTSTVPYNITVKATTASFANGANTLPLNVLTISGVNAGDNIITRTLSATEQNLFSSSQTPVIARSFDLKYTVAANAALLNKAAGTYSTTLVFTYTAP